MKTINLKNKKVGIWGFGIVGKSVLKYVQQHTSTIQILDQNFHPEADTIIQTPENIQNFLDQNEIIIASPGIKLHGYQKYRNKFVQELDLFSQEFKGHSVAITGTVGKTTITSLLAQCIPNSLAAGNIGFAMLETLNMNPTPGKIILELSSYQLDNSQFFAPDLAIWTNFYPNHLDHHKDEQEYFAAKCNLLKHQTKDQITLLPCELIEKIIKQVTPKAQIYLFSQTSVQNTSYPTFFINQNQLLLQHKDETTLVFDNFNQLPNITFTQNWLIILAGLHLQKISLNNFKNLTQSLKPSEHRLEFVKNLHGIQIYNDSKSTVWQATKEAVDSFENKKIALFLGGISKGTDRTPLIQHLQNKNVTVFAFGKEAKLLATLCQQFQINHSSSSTLQESLNVYLTQQNNFEILLFSPAGASFDLFKNFEDRGTQFKKMIFSL